LGLSIFRGFNIFDGLRKSEEIGTGEIVVVVAWENILAFA